MNNEMMTDQWVLVNLTGGARIPVNFRYVEYFQPGTGGHGSTLFFVSGTNLQVADNVANLIGLIGNATDDITTLQGDIARAA